jgi:DNA-binding transcriptional ArsR family regulator
MSELDRYEMWIFELALAVSERQNVEEFFGQVLLLDEPMLKKSFFGYEIDDIEAELSMTELLINQENEIDLIGIKYLEPMVGIVEIAKRAALSIDTSAVFSSFFERLVKEGVYNPLLEKFKENTVAIGRHPLSYSQEHMGKPFWNIADYEIYELIPVYLISPFRFRLMDSKTMIYVQSVISKSNEQLSTEELADVLKVLADPMRLKLLKLIHMHPMYGKEISDQLGIATSTVSHHLDVLSKHGLVNLEKVKHIKYFSANMMRLKEIQTSQYLYFS